MRNAPVEELTPRREAANTVKRPPEKSPEILSVFAPLRDPSGVSESLRDSPRLNPEVREGIADRIDDLHEAGVRFFQFID